MARKIALIALALIISLGGAVSAQLPVPKPNPIIGARMPSISPDGKKIAFVYRGDVWIADSNGGNATALTRNIEMDAYPRFSPDGNWVAFASLRNGNWDIFVVPAIGGTVQQLTYHSNGEVPNSWSPDGKQILYCAKIDAEDYILCSLDVKTLRIHKVIEDYALINSANCSPDGSMLIYTRDGFPWTRPRYMGSGAAQISILDTKKGVSRTITNDDRQHLWPQFLPGGKQILAVTIGDKTPSTCKIDQSIGKFMDTSARTPNLWVFDLNGKGRQVTSFVGGSVRCPAAAIRTGDIVFEYEHDLWMMRSGKKQPKKIALFASEDETQNSVRMETLTSGVDEAEPSSDGKTFAFGLHGEIWTVLVDKPSGVERKSAEIARRLTDWAGDDSDFTWSSDGKKIYFTSDREFNIRIYELDVESLAVKPLWNRTEDVSGLHISPDRSELAFWVAGPEGGLYVMSLATGKTRKLVDLPAIQRYGQGGGYISWSPDAKWLAYNRAEDNGAWNIWIVPAAGGKSVNITQLNAYHGLPTWSPDGKYLFFTSDRGGDGLYVLPLTKEPARTSDIDIKFEKPKDAVKVAIDFDGASRRIRKLSSQAPESDLTITPDGKIAFISGGDIWYVTYDGKDTKRVTTGGGCSIFRVLGEGKKWAVVRNGELQSVRPEDGAMSKIDFKADWERDVRAERKAAFTQFWRSYNRAFYDPNMHGRDWNAIRERYEPLLDAVGTREEFALLLNMMVGELDASHSEVSAAPGGNPSPSTAILGFMFDYSYEGPGIRVASVPDGAPASFEKTRIKPGEYILSINGQDVTLDEYLFKALNNKWDRPMEFLVNSEPKKEGARTVRYTCMTWNEWFSLLYKNRVDRMRKYIEEKSGGAIGYVHINYMLGPDQARFEREVYEYSLGKKAMIIDVRNNGGGNISDTLIDWLERKPYGFRCSRDSKPTEIPKRAWELPIVVLINEKSKSNAEMFPYAMRERGLAKLVGMPTPGYVISTLDLPLVDGTSARMPMMGVYRLDGTPQENIGEKPDFTVPLTDEDWLAGRDPQVDKAIQVLIKDVK
ncbi:MAG: S41 family peptidase [Armatimonadota bacterium]